jgi:hypothetical protein
VKAADDRGLPDPDPIRVLTFGQARTLRVLLRPHWVGRLHHGRTIPLADQRALASFLGSLTFAGPMHGGRALDDPSPTDDWPATPSLAVTWATGPAPHCFYWFTECGREEPGGLVGYLLEGAVRFGDLSVARDDGTPVPVTELAAAGLRWWWGVSRSGDLARTPP